MKTKNRKLDVSALKNRLLDAYTTAYMLDNRIEASEDKAHIELLRAQIETQHTRIDQLIAQLYEAGVKEHELIDIKVTAFYIANPLDN